MKNVRVLVGLCALLAVCVSLTVSAASASASAPASAPTPSPAPAASAASPAPAATSEQVLRGEYLVHRAGLCIDCHSPRNERGEFIVEKHLTGSPLAFVPTVPMPWVPAAPRLAGLPAGFTGSELSHFLMTGERPHGRPPALPPMPAYRFNREDADAIVAYLRTLPAEGAPEVAVAHATPPTP